MAAGSGPSTAAAAEDPAVAHGLKGEYYTHSAPGAFDFDELKATAFDPSLDFGDLGPRLKARTGQDDDVSVRWTGKITPEKSGEHTFSVKGDNGFRVWVDGKPVIDHWVDDWDNEQTSEPVALEAGKAYDFKVEYFEHYGGQNLHVNWTPPGGEKQPVPQSAYTLPDGFDYDGPTSVAVEKDGRTLTFGFAQPLAAPPAGFGDHLKTEIGGTEWPRGKPQLDPADPKRLVIPLDEPVVGGHGGSADIRYDGEGGLATADGKAIGDFWTSGPINSEYQLESKWADDVGPDNAHPEYPRPQMTREAWKNLNGEWQFAGAEEGEQPPVGKELDEKILVPYPVESQLSGIERHEDRMWYKRSFEVPEGWKVGDGKRLQLNFDAVDWQAEVYVNGQKVTAHKGGYDRFSVDVTDALKGTGPQELIVGVYDPTDAKDGENPPMGKQRLDPSGIWYTSSSGIWQTVWMEPVAADRAEDVKTTPDIEGEKVAVKVRGVKDGVPVTATAYDGDKEVGKASGTTGAALDVPVPDPHLWSPDDPHLYQLKVTVGEDEVESYFGMRSVGVKTIDGKQRTILNGKPIFLMATLDQGFWPDGLHTPPTDEAQEYDLKAHKELGFNSVRKHIKVENDRWFYQADKLGLLVWQDMPSMNTIKPSDAAKAQFEHEMKEMIEQHDSHPSVVMWVTLNEGWGQYDVARLADQAKEWDPTRLVNGMSGINLGEDGGTGDILDEHGYPSPALPDPDGKRALVSGEYGGLGLAVPGHSFPVQHTYVGVEKDKYTDEYLAKLKEVEKLAACEGNNGAVYTQITDVEGELNGLLTYDRKVLKGDTQRIKAAHEALIKGAGDGTLPCTS
ncbi:glycoside hydrolase family 2 [Streptomyces sp. A7024]|uniref:Glycoside hydrolase family 2 n=1 Tax=Streptomyces coryli TaxID=1128680 RepID=A0A6G4U5P0_9ACTN|nr:PA14 domain-containing protein [Streptomyces coryli]NGN67413.1 glycoside hydrolase family 2 [Streptomyces coryli]